MELKKFGINANFFFEAKKARVTVEKHQNYDVLALDPGPYNRQKT